MDAVAPAPCAWPELGDLLDDVLDLLLNGVVVKQATRWMAPALLVFAGEPASTKSAVRRNVRYGSKAAGHIDRFRRSGPSLHLAFWVGAIHPECGPI